MSDDLSLSQVGVYYGCGHARLSEPRARTVANGSVQYRQQCLSCGIPVGNPVTKAVACERTGGYPPPMFDEVLLADKRSRAVVGFRERREAERSARRIWYNDYLQSEEWQQKRRLVLERENFLCEGCRQNQAIQVHHLSYEHVGDELLWELVAVCEKCHDRAHATPDDDDDVFPP